jgi:molybdopterin-guanine dinucleotide biosynthesis protein MobB
MNRMPIIVSILGWSGTGKTTFIEAAIGECARRGIAAAAVKKSRHSADLPSGTKDSARFRAAGASPSIYLSESEMVILSAPPALLDASSIAALCPEASIIFCEGLDVEGSSLVLVAGDETGESALKRPLSSIDILIARDSAMLKVAGSKYIKAFTPGECGQFIDHLVLLEEQNAKH